MDVKIGMANRDDFVEIIKLADLTLPDRMNLHELKKYFEAKLLCNGFGIIVVYKSGSVPPVRYLGFGMPVAGESFLLI